MGLTSVARTLASAVALLVLGLATALVRPADPKPVVIDTDADIDDLMAISYLLTSPLVDVKAILVSSDAWSSQWAGVVNVMRLTQFFGCPQIPVAFMEGYLGNTQLNFKYPVDVPRQDLVNSVDTFLPDAIDLPFNPYPPAWQSAPQLLLQVLKASPTQVDIIEMGALTNLAAALHRDSELFLSKIRTLYMSGGQVQSPSDPANPNETFPYSGGLPKYGYGPPPMNTSFTGEPSGVVSSNIFLDAISASQVFTSGIDLLLVTHDAEYGVPIAENDTMFIPESCCPKRRELMTGFVTQFSPHTNEDITALRYWDAVATVLMVELLPTGGRGPASTCTEFAQKQFTVMLEAGPRYARLLERDFGAKARECLGTDADVFKNIYFSGVCRVSNCRRSS